MINFHIKKKIYFYSEHICFSVTSSAVMPAQSSYQFVVYVVP